YHPTRFRWLRRIVLRELVNRLRPAFGSGKEKRRNQQDESEEERLFHVRRQKRPLPLPTQPADQRRPRECHLISDTCTGRRGQICHLLSDRFESRQRKRVTGRVTFSPSAADACVSRIA